MVNLAKTVSQFKRKFFFKNCLNLIAILLLLSGCHRSPTTASGYIEGNFVYIASQASGELTALAVKRGQRVKKGQLLFKIDPTPYHDRVSEAKAQLTKAEANLRDTLYGERASELAEIEAEIKQAQASANYLRKQLIRDQHLLASGGISRQTFDQTKRDVKESLEKVSQLKATLTTAKLPKRADLIQVAKANVDEAKANLLLSQWNLDQTMVRAKEEGIVFDNFYWPFEKVPANQPVISLLDFNKMRLIFYVPKQLVQSLKIGQVVHFYTTDDRLYHESRQSGDQNTAIISFISPQAEYTPPVIYSDHSMNKLVYRIEAKFRPKQAKKWHPGQLVTVKLS